MKITVIDFETANNHPASACSIGIVVFEEGIVIHEAVHLIKPDPTHDYFEPFNIAIHGISPEDVEKAPGFDVLWPDLLPWFRDSVLVAHNAPFDMGVLNALLQHYGISKPLVTYLDTVEIARKMWPYLKNHRLNTVCEFLEIPLDHHEALSDARGSALILMNAMIQLDEYALGPFIHRLNLKERAL